MGNTSVISFHVEIVGAMVTNGYMNITGNVYASGTLVFDVDPSLTDGSYILPLFQYDGNLTGEWHLSPMISSSGRKRQDGCSSTASPVSQPHQYSVGLNITCSDAEIQDESGNLVRSVIYGVVVGGVLLLAIVVVVIVLVTRQRSRRNFETVEVEMRRKFDLTHVVLEEQIGAGAFGDVYKGRWLQTQGKTHLQRCFR